MKHYFRQHIVSFSLFLIFTISVLSACTPEKWHRTLSFFFDGVPDSSRTKSVVSNDSIIKKDTATITITANSDRSGYVIHSPYKEKQCDVCHDPNHRADLTQALPDLCYNCHANFNTKYTYLHGPVASGACIECHSPHLSKNKKLLVRENQDLCLYCHEKTDVLKNEVHKEIGETNCTDCHNPHGGDDKYIFK